MTIRTLLRSTLAGRKTSLKWALVCAGAALLFSGAALLFYASYMSGARAHTGTLQGAASNASEAPTSGPPSLTSPESQGINPQFAGDDWGQYLHDASGSGFTSETLIGPSNAANLKPKAGWPVKLTNGSACPSTNDQCSSLIASEPAVATVAGTSLVYVGSWNGDEYALCGTSCTVGGNTYTSGQIVWSTYLGRTSGCGGPFNSQIKGVTSTAAVASVAIGGSARPVVYVGGGGDIALSGSVTLGATAQLFALDALTGAVIWQTALGSAPSHYVWSSPVFANNSIYLGMASLQDCPLVQGQVLEIDPVSGQVMNLFGAVASGCLGASVWGSAAVDPAGNVYVATGNGFSCKTAEIYSEAVIKLTSTLGLVSSWQVPRTEQTPDGDFGSTPTLFTGTVTTGGPSRSLVGVANKNGTYYVFDQDDISAGPVERLHIAVGGGSPTGGQGSISPSSWDGNLVYVAGGGTTIDGESYSGSVRAYNPNNLSSPVWQHGFSSGPVVAAVSTNPGLAMIGSWDALTVVDSATGATAFTASATTRSHVFGGASIAYGVIYQGDTAGVLHAFSLGGL